MDLRGLMSSKEAPGLSKGGRKEEMKKGYKKPGASSLANTRSLRTLQVTLTLTQESVNSTISIINALFTESDVFFSFNFLIVW